MSTLKTHMLWSGTWSRVFRYYTSVSQEYCTFSSGLTNILSKKTRKEQAYSTHFIALKMEAVHADYELSCPENLILHNFAVRISNLTGLFFLYTLSVSPSRWEQNGPLQGSLGLVGIDTFLGMMWWNELARQNKGDIMKLPAGVPTDRRSSKNYRP
jgi:hypothetical protein